MRLLVFCGSCALVAFGWGFAKASWRDPDHSWIRSLLFAVGVCFVLDGAIGLVVTLIWIWP